VLDVVYNHLGPAGNYLSEFGPYFTSRHRTHWGDAMNFDGPGSAEVRRYVIDNALMWMRDYQCDGLRLDAIHAIVDDSARHILEQLADEVEAWSCHLRRPLFLIAESDRNDPRVVRHRDAGGYGIDAVWSDEWHHAVHAALTGERRGYYEDFGPLSMVAKAAKQAWVYDGLWSPHRRRVHGRSPAGLSGHHFVISVQNHDQVGNRAIGDRLSTLTTPGRLKVAAALMLTGPFTPMLFQGEEWGATAPFQYFTDHEDPELGKAVSMGRRSEFAAFGWDPAGIPDPQDPDTFSRSKLDWAQRSKDEHQEMESWYRQLIWLRRSHPELTDPRLEGVETSYDEGQQWLQVQRGRLVLAANLAPAERLLPVPAAISMLCTSDDSIMISENRLLLPPDSVALFEREK
jgi:maltooligosyltrehalose trehalohydrolase